MELETDYIKNEYYFLQSESDRSFIIERNESSR